MTKVTTTMMIMTATTVNITGAISTAFPLFSSPPCDPAREHNYVGNANTHLSKKFLYLKILYLIQLLKRSISVCVSNTCSYLALALGFKVLTFHTNHGAFTQ